MLIAQSNRTKNKDGRCVMELNINSPAYFDYDKFREDFSLMCLK